MRTLIRALIASAAVLVAVNAAAAQDKIRIGLIYTLSGPAAVLGQQSKNGFQLALKDLGGKMAGHDVQLFIADDQLKPGLAVQKVKELLDRDHVDFVVGPIFSNVLNAIHKPVMDAGKILISTNAGASSFAGKACNPDFFVTSYQNDQIFETLGKIANDKGYKRVFAMVPNYQAGRDALAGFKRTYKGKIVAEALVPLKSLDFQAQLSKLSSLKPDALFTFMPGGLGISLVKQFNQAGLKGKVPIISAFTADEATLPALKGAAEGIYGALTWAPNTDNPQNKKFVAQYLAAYKAVPASYAMQAYDAAMLINSAVKAVNGKVSDTKAVSAALKKADFKSLRGTFKFNVNGYPIQNFYLTKVAKRPDGLF
ncbi:MAG: ABC transporter substrate-binding protein, partial [Pseudolabrys sp.]